MSYNIRFGGVGREALISDVIGQAKPDIVALQEATSPEVVERLAAMTNMPHWASKSGQSAAFISRIAVEHFEWQHHRKMQRAILAIDVDGVRLYNVHLRATHSNYTERGRMGEVRALLDSVGAHGEAFHVLVGDFNTLAPGELLDMQKLPIGYRLLAMMLGGRITFRAIQIMLDAGYADCYRRLHSEAGLTFPAWEPNVRLDYIFALRQFAERVRHCDVMTGIREPAKASDHLPLIAEISSR